ncbi:MAG: NADH-quinone oxidoreductase subunit NuoE [Desulfobacterales bacterium]|nr:NADH-quinone oxidoreductase subunit NuoE [Desulfobacterales bacterium]
MDKDLIAAEADFLAELPQQLDAYKKDRSHLIPILQMIQKEVAFLPTEALHIVAAHLEISAAEVYGVATFYNQFRFTPPGKYPFKICLGTACHVKGGEIILENVERKLDIKEGETTPDREFSVERVACVGCCALAPVAMIGETIHGNMAPSKVEGLFTRIAVEKEMAERENQKNES